MNWNSKLTILLWLPIISMAGSQLNQKENQNIPTTSPIPDGGITILPLVKMDLPENIKQEELTRLSQQRLYGYSISNTPYARELLTIKATAIKEIRTYKNNSDPYDTHFKRNISEIKLAFPFSGLTIIEPKNIIGFVATGTWKNGWTGITEYFTYDALGTCRFIVNNMTLTHGAIIISSESVRYDINKNPNTLNISGNNLDGFIYNINWYNNGLDKELECANLKYSPKITKKLIELAIMIDK